MFPGWEQEVTSESWKADHHDWGLSVFFKVTIPETEGQPGSSMDHMLSVHAPWKGESPPVPIRLEDPDTFARREDSVWRRRDKSGRFYPVNVHGERVAKPRGRDVEEPHPNKSRPSSVSPHFWWKVLTATRTAQWWTEN